MAALDVAAPRPPINSGRSLAVSHSTAVASAAGSGESFTSGGSTDSACVYFQSSGSSETSKNRPGDVQRDRAASPPKLAEARLHVAVDVLLVGELDEVANRGAKDGVLLDHLVTEPVFRPVTPAACRRREPALANRKGARLSSASRVRQAHLPTSPSPHQVGPSHGYSRRPYRPRPARDGQGRTARPTSTSWWTRLSFSPPRTPKISSLPQRSEPPPWLRSPSSGRHRRARSAPASKICLRVPDHHLLDLALAHAALAQAREHFVDDVGVLPLGRQCAQCIPPAQITGRVVREDQALGVALAQSRATIRAWSRSRAGCRARTCPCPDMSRHPRSSLRYSRSLVSPQWPMITSSRPTPSSRKIRCCSRPPLVPRPCA